MTVTERPSPVSREGERAARLDQVPLVGSAQHRCRIRTGEPAFIRDLAALAGPASRCGTGHTIRYGAYHGLRVCDWDRAAAGPASLFISCSWRSL